MKIWFEKEDVIQCDFEILKKYVDVISQYFIGVVSTMPGIISVELLEEGDNFVTIKTNKGTINRFNIIKKNVGETVVIEFDEVYRVGKFINVSTHHVNTFLNHEQGVKQHLTLGDIKTTGFMGFFYKNFRKAGFGNALLSSNKTYFEKLYHHFKS